MSKHGRICKDNGSESVMLLRVFSVDLKSEGSLDAFVFLCFFTIINCRFNKISSEAERCLRT